MRGNGRIQATCDIHWAACQSNTKKLTVVSKLTV